MDGFQLGCVIAVESVWLGRGCREEEEEEEEAAAAARGGG